jgi:hypothetical protein
MWRQNFCMTPQHAKAQVFYAPRETCQLGRKPRLLPIDQTNEDGA